MNNATINIKVDPQTKQEIQRFASELGIPVSAILNAQIKQILRDRTLTLNTGLEPTPYLINILNQVVGEAGDTKHITMTESEEEISNHLDSL